MLRELEGRVGCDLRLRGNVLTLDGDEGEVRDAAAVVEELVDLVERGHELAPATIGTVAGAGGLGVLQSAGDTPAGREPVQGVEVAAVLALSRAEDGVRLSHAGRTNVGGRIRRATCSSVTLRRSGCTRNQATAASSVTNSATRATTIYVGVNRAQSRP